MSLRSYGIIVAAFFTVSIAYAVRYGYGMLLPGMLDSLKITKTEAGIISAAYFCAYTVFSPVLGVLSDRFNVRLLLTFFPALLAVGAFLMAYVTTVRDAALVFALAGVGHAACWAPVVALVQQWVGDRYRGTALAVATMGSGVGIAAWSLWLPIVVERSSYRMGWMQMGIFGFFVAALNFFLIRNPDRGLSATTIDSPARRLNPTPTYLQLLVSRNLWLVGMSYACIGFSVLVPFTFLSVYAMQELSLSYGIATRLFTIIAVAGLVGKLVLGILSDRFGRVLVMMLCGLLLGSGCWGLFHLDGLPGKYFCVTLVGIGFGAVWPLYAAAAIDFFPISLAGSVIGLWTVFLGVGSILSPILCGWTIDRYGTFSWAFDLGCAIALLSAVFLIPLRAEAGMLQRNQEKAIV
ncbi:MAG: MFS transporter [Proteobacteria bacterium]|nr:MFS transporter [Pseudomonadota bacterium]